MEHGVGRLARFFPASAGRDRDHLLHVPTRSP